MTAIHISQSQTPIVYEIFSWRSLEFSKSLAPTFTLLCHRAPKFISHVFLGFTHIKKHLSIPQLFQTSSNHDVSFTYKRLILLASIHKEVFIFLSQAYFSQHNVLYTHLCCCKWQEFHCFYGWVTLHFVYIPHFLYPFTHQYTWLLGTALNERGRTQRSLIHLFPFLWTYTK